MCVYYTSGIEYSCPTIVVFYYFIFSILILVEKIQCSGALLSKHACLELESFSVTVQMTEVVHLLEAVDLVE